MQDRSNSAKTKPAVLEEAAPTHPAIPRRGQDGSLPRQGEIPLSFGQQRLWFIEQLAPNTFAPLSAALPFAGPFQPASLEQSLNDMIRRHEILRTTFASQDGSPFQVIGPAYTLALPIEDLSQLPPDEQQRQARQLAQQAAQQPFDLHQGPLLRCTLLRFAPFDHLLIVTMHQIISDAWSVDLFQREVQKLYAAFAAGQASPLPELPIQYADFAIWQHEQLQGETLEAQRAYWRAQVKGVPPLLDLPTDFTHPAIQSFKRASLDTTLALDLSKALKALSRKQKATLSMTLLAAFQTLLQRYSGQADIPVASSVATRQHPDLQGLLGFVSNTVVLRASFADNVTFSELLAQVRSATRDAADHEDFPFEKLIEELGQQRQLSYTPLVQVMFSMRDAGTGFSGQQQPSVIDKARAVHNPGAQFDLCLYASEQEDAIQLEVVYNADLFAQPRIAQLLDQLNHLFVQIVASPDEDVARFSLVDPKAAKLLPDPTTPIDAAWEGAIAARFSAHAQRAPDHIAVKDAQIALTYAQLDRLSNQLAHALRAQGIQPQDPVAIYGHRSTGLPLALLGILKAGAAFIILDPDYPASRLIDCLELTQPKGWIHLAAAGACPPAVNQFIQNIACRIELTQTTEQSALRKYPIESPGIVVEPDWLAYIAFTSGSTGKPKGIEGTHRPLSHFFQWYGDTFGFTEAACFTLLSGLSHDPIMRDLFAPLWLGATLCIPDPEDRNNPRRLVEWMQQEAITVTHLTPAMMQVLSSSGKSMTLPKLRHACFGGALLTKRDVSKLRDLAPAVTCVNFYGATETPQAMGFYIVPEQLDETSARDVIPVGRGIDAVQLLVLNQQLQLAGVGETGEIHIRTPYLARGYLGNLMLTAERFITNPFTHTPNDRLYKSGDIGRYLPDGRIEILGRNDHQVKIRGFRIELGEIEATLTQHPAVYETVVLAREDTPGDPRLVAYVVPKPSSTIIFNEVRAFLKDRLPEYMIPAACIVLDALPLTPNGKLDRQALPAPEAQAQTEEGDYVPPSLIEHYQLLEIWEGLLEARPIGIRDNFFLLGGHSLLAVQMIARIEDVFGKKLTLATLFTRPTIEEISHALQQQEEESTLRAPIYAIQSGGTRQPFFYMHGFVRQGGFYCYRLARELGPDQPFYALQPYQLEGLHAPPTFEEIAASHIEAIRSVQPEGPYLLGGFCNGALVAVEMTRQLQAQGQQVNLLVMVDPEEPASVIRRLARTIIHGIGGVFRISPARQFSLYLRFRSVYASVFYATGKRGFTIPTLSALTQSLDQLRENWSNVYFWVMPGRIPTITAARQAFFWKGDAALDRGRWGRLAEASQADIFTISGEHLEWTEDNISALAEQVTPYLVSANAVQAKAEALVSS